MYRRLQEHGWLQPDRRAETPTSLGLVLQVEHENETKFIAEPQTIDDNVKVVCRNLNLGAVFTMSSDLTHLFFTKIGKDDFEITLSPNNVTVPVVDSLQELAQDGTGVRRRDFCCFVRKERLVLVWNHVADGLMLHGGEVDSKLMSSVSRRIFSSPVSKLTFPRSGVHKSPCRRPLQLLIKGPRITVEARVPPSPRASSERQASFRARVWLSHTTTRKTSPLLMRSISELKTRSR